MRSFIRSARIGLLLLSAAVGMPAASAIEPAPLDPGAFVNALWLVQRFGGAEAAGPRHDVHIKATLAKALGKDGSLSHNGVKGLMDAKTFARLAGPDARLDPEEIRRALSADVPPSRAALLPRVAAHAALLTTSFDMIDEPHRKAGEALVEWIAANYKPGQPLGITFVCTGNSRRSILGATMGNVAANYCGLPEIRCASGGTAPSAFNPRTVAALSEIGVAIEPSGREARRGEPATANPIYRVRWGTAASKSQESDAFAPETTEFSKRYDDPSNPQSGFAALMVCSEADAGCPVVRGSSLRLSMPYLDPKIYDGSPFEAAKYAERRDDIGRLMLAVMTEARNRLAAAGKLR